MIADKPKPKEWSLAEWAKFWDWEIIKHTGNPWHYSKGVYYTVEKTGGIFHDAIYRPGYEEPRRFLTEKGAWMALAHVRRKHEREAAMRKNQRINLHD